ncbi:MAG TPA: Imm32 family immunity protein [Chryseolinea sp.]|nr:Imm32 family immunity protein [Chryseolinea sp.]
MESKIFTIEIDEQGNLIEMHVNKDGAEYLRSILDNLIRANENSDKHLMTPDWGGTELSSESQNKADGVRIVHHLKLMYWK